MKKTLRIVVIVLLIAVLGLIVLVGSLTFSSKKTFKDAERRSKAQTVVSSARKFFVENQRFPSTLTELIQNEYLEESYKDLKPPVSYMLTSFTKKDDCLVMIKLESGEMFRVTCKEGMGFQE